MSIPIFAAPQLPTQPSASSNLSSTAPRPRTRSLLLFSPLTYGNSATPLQVPAQDPSHTHKWTVYLRTDPNIIERVTFTLHASFHQPERILKHPPYEVTETGWGEFEIAINIRFHHEEKDVTIYHHLKLHTGADTIQGNVPGTIICEKYDELIFNEPTDVLAEILQRNAAQRVKKPKESQWNADMEQRELSKLSIAQGRVSQQIQVYKERLDKSYTRMSSLQSEMT